MKTSIKDILSNTGPSGIDSSVTAKVKERKREIGVALCSKHETMNEYLCRKKMWLKSFQIHNLLWFSHFPSVKAHKHLGKWFPNSAPLSLSISCLDWLENTPGVHPNLVAVGCSPHRSAEPNLPLIINEESGRGKMHFVIIWLNADSADLFIGDKNCLLHRWTAQIHTAHTHMVRHNTCAYAHTHAHNCNVSSL